MYSIRRHPKQLWVLLSFVANITSLEAQITTDGSLGPQVKLTGPEMRIGADLGQTRGGNLFHSFQQFDIPTEHSATFTGPDQIQRVIGRITGGQLSHIDGQLRSEVGQADLYLLNPAGMVMGPHASVDVPAALHLSTADELRFDDGTRFSARDPGNGSTLTLAAPEAFGFLGRHPPGDLTLNGTWLDVREGQTLTLSGGDVTLAGRREHLAGLDAPGGTLRLEAVGEAEMALSLREADPLTLDSSLGAAADLAHRGQLDLTQVYLETSGEGGGRIVLAAGRADVSDATLIAENRGSTDATGGIEARITGLLQLKRSAFYADTAAAGRGGIARVLADQLWMHDAYLTSDAMAATGEAGGVAVQTDDTLMMDKGSLIQSSTYAAGNAGRVTLRVDDAMNVMNESQIFSETWGDGDAGTVILTIDGLLEVTHGSGISSSTFDEGDAGNVVVNAGSVRLDGAGIWSDALLGTSANAGHVTLNVNEMLEILRGAEISSSTWTAGNAGELSLTAGSVRLDGEGMAGELTGLASTAEPGSEGVAGRITLNVAGLLDIGRGAKITSSTWGMGRAGDIQLNASRLRVQDGLIISLAGTQATGQAGQIKVTADWMHFSEESRIAIASINPDLPALSATGGNPPQLQLHAASLTLDNSTINAQSLGQVAAASIDLQAGKAILANNSRMTTEALHADAGPIRFDGGMLFVQNSQITTTAEHAAGKGGDIHLTPKQLILEQGFIQANAGSGNGGDITIASAALLHPATQNVIIGGHERLVFNPHFGASVIQAVAPRGVSGKIELTAPDLDMIASLVPLRTPFQDPNAILQNLCQLFGTPNASTLIERGRGGLPHAVTEPVSATLSDTRLKQLLREF